MKPSDIAKSNTEHAHQSALICWTRLAKTRQLLPKASRIYACPNGGSRGAGEGARFKAEGVRAGIPDLFLPVPWGRWPGLYIEMKKPDQATALKGGLSDAQIDEIAALQTDGYPVFICYDWKDAAAVICQYFGEIGFTKADVWE